MFSKEEHEAKVNSLISFLNVEGVNQAELSVIIQDLRNNYNDVTTDFEKNTTDITSYKEQNEGLRSANMKILTQLGTQDTEIFAKNKQDIIAKKNGTHNSTDSEDEKTMTLEDISKNFI